MTTIETYVDGEVINTIKIEDPQSLAKELLIQLASRMPQRDFAKRITYFDPRHGLSGGFTYDSVFEDEDKVFHITFKE